MNRGNKIKLRRQDLGLSQRELARKSDISSGFMCQIEKENRGFSINTMVKICKALSLPLESLLEIEPYSEELPQIDRIEEKINTILNNMEQWLQ